MKSDETLEKLAQNPHYHMSEEEAERLKEIQAAPKATSKDVTKKKVTATLGSATVKETGKLTKHSGDPVTEK